MSYVYFNNNPRGLNVGDCVIRAASKALNQSWETTYLDLVTVGYDMADMPSSNSVLNSYLRSKGFHKKTIDDLCPSCYSVRDFADEHFKGIYILGMGSHVVCVIDGQYFDSWNSGDEVPIYFWFKDIY